MNECKSMRVPLVKPKSIDKFLQTLNAIQEQRRKASHLLFDEVETEFIDKEKFLNTQNETLKGIRENFANLKDYSQVLETV